jgi:hypothetical protein
MRMTASLAIGLLVLMHASATPPPAGTTDGSASLQPSPASPPDSTLVLDFTRPDATVGLRSIDDVVMGGVSASRTSLRDGALRFEGVVSLERGGGFASCRGPVTLPSGTRALLVELRGDGKRYRLTLKDADDNGGPQHQASFTAPPDWTTMRFEARDFQASFRGRPVAMPPPELEHQRAIGLLIADRQAGAFNLEIRRVWAQR